MPEKPKPSLTMYDMFSGMLKDHLGRSEFISAFKEVVAQIQKLKLSNAQEIAAMRQHIQQLSDKLNTESGGALQATKKEAMDYCMSMMQKMSRQMEEKLLQIEIKMDAKLDSLKDGETPTDEKLTNLIQPLIPQAKDGSPDMAEDIRNKLELLKGKERLNISAIDGIEELKVEFKKGSGNSVAGGRQQLLVGGTKKGVANYLNLVAGSGATLTHTLVNGVQTVTFATSGGAGYQVPTGTVNGVNQVFVFTTAPSAIAVDGAVLRRVASDSTVNWTAVGGTITLAVAPTFDVYGVS